MTFPGSKELQAVIGGEEMELFQLLTCPKSLGNLDRNVPQDREFVIFAQLDQYQDWWSLTSLSLVKYVD